MHSQVVYPHPQYHYWFLCALIGLYPYALYPHTVSSFYSFTGLYTNSSLSPYGFSSYLSYRMFSVTLSLPVLESFPYTILVPVTDLWLNPYTVFPLPLVEFLNDFPLPC